MPLTKAHKAASKQKILKSAFTLFTEKGFNGVTIDALMQHCSLTRGAFYSHFASKSALYNEALRFAASETTLAQLKPSKLSNKLWLVMLLDNYLSIAHVNGNNPCPLAFLVTDIANKNNAIKDTYANIYQNMNNALLAYTQEYTTCKKADILAVTSMMIGAVAICRTMKDKKAISDVLQACRCEAGIKLGGI